MKTSVKLVVGFGSPTAKAMPHSSDSAGLSAAGNGGQFPYLTPSGRRVYCRVLTNRPRIAAIDPAEANASTCRGMNHLSLSLHKHPLSLIAPRLAGKKLHSLVRIDATHLDAQLKHCSCASTCAGSCGATCRRLTFNQALWAESNSRLWAT